MVDYEQINGVMSILILIGLLFLLGFILIHGINPCSNCKFEVNGKVLKVNEFFEVFSAKCLTLKKDVHLGNVSAD